MIVKGIIEAHGSTARYLVIVFFKDDKFERQRAQLKNTWEINGDYISQSMPKLCHLIELSKM